MNIITNANNCTKYFETDGQKTVQRWPCRCGETHDDIGIWLEHQCDHDEIVQLKDMPFGYCTQCGKTIDIVQAHESDFIEEVKP